MHWITKWIILLICGVQMINHTVVCQPVNIEGYVIDTKNKPIVDSQVFIEKQMVGVATDSNGYFRIDNLKNELGIVKISCLGFRTKHLNLELFLKTLNPTIIVLKDTVNNLAEMVVSATRVPQNTNALVQPVEVISKEQIKGKGLVRLNEVLAEQAGLQIIGDHGAGLQMQGLSSDYILILVDGDPVIGRTAGTLDLSRIAIGNIERIEIVKGPSSSLYGNEALAGVVNIITTKSTHNNSLHINTLVRTNNTLNTGLETSLNSGRWNTSVFFDRLSSEGYDLNPEVVGKTVPEFTAYTFKPKVSHQFSDQVRADLGFLYFNDKQNNTSVVERDSKTFQSIDKATRRDLVITPSIKLDLLPKHQILFKNSISFFGAESEHLLANKETIYDESYFHQFLNRSQIKYDWTISSQHRFIAGTGYEHQKVNATRYEGRKGLSSTYLFAQYNGKLGNKISINPSSRYDFNHQYGSSFNPKMVLSYTPKSWVEINASVGTGFKTPDFRQLLLNFTNPTVGYSVFGSKVAQEKTESLIKNGEIAAVLTDLEMLGDLKPEKSLAYNFGITLDFSNEITFKSSLFLNKITNLIENAPIARKTSGEYVYSYFNKNKVITEGIETSIGWPFSKNFSANISYQYLLAKDLEMLDLIKAGKVFRKNAVTGETERVSTKDYGGLANRSKHSGNFKTSYQNYAYHIKCALRGVYRGSWGVGDLNGNKVIDASNEYAKGYLIWNLSINKTLFQKLDLEGGIMNLLGTKSPHDTSLSGRVWYAGVQLHLISKKNNSLNQ